MKEKLFTIVLLVGVLCFIAGAVALFLGVSAAPLNYALPVIGMILIGAGASGKRRANV